MTLVRKLASMAKIVFKPYILKKNSALHHIFKKKYRANGFNDSGVGSRRFDPIFDPKGKVIPSYYLAFSDLVAMSETLIRANIDGVSELTWYPENNAMIKAGELTCVAQVQNNREMNCIDLETFVGPNGEKLMAPLLRQGNVAYPTLCYWATYFAHNFEDYDGLCWHSYQRGVAGERSIMLFGDRVLPSDLKVICDEALNSSGNLERLRDALRTLETAIPPWLVK